MEESGAVWRVQRTPVKLRGEMWKCSRTFREKPEEWKERTLEGKLQNGVLALTLPLTGDMNLSKSLSLSASGSLPVK